MRECHTLAFRREAVGGEAGSRATVVGNRAGVVEWANDAFARLSGIPLADTVNKPVTHFLERTGLDLEVVDFVAQHFFDGRPCRLEFPFERPDGRRIEVLLEVEALRDALGEIDRFRAAAQESLEPAADEPAPPPIRGTECAPTPLISSAFAPHPPPDFTATAELGPAIHRALAAARPGHDPDTADGSEAWLLDLALSPEPLAIHAHAAALEELVCALLRAARASLARADHAWGTITLTTGRTTPHRRFISKVHAIPVGAAAQADASRIHLEVHDTGAPLENAVLARLRRIAASASDPDSAVAPDSEGRTDPAPEHPGILAAATAGAADAREGALVAAIQRARRLGASIHLDSTPGCGNQVLVLFPD